MQTMPPEKDPAFWASLLAPLREHGLAAALGFALTWLRIHWEGKETSLKRQLLEAALGGVLAFLVGIAAEKFGLSGGWSYAVAGAVGIFGVEQVRQLSRRWVEKKVEA